MTEGKGFRDWGKRFKSSKLRAQAKSFGWCGIARMEKAANGRAVLWDSLTGTGQALETTDKLF